MRDLVYSETLDSPYIPISKLSDEMLGYVEARVRGGSILFENGSTAQAALKRITIERTIRSLGYEAGWAS